MQNKFAVIALVISYWQAFFAMYQLYNFLVIGVNSYEKNVNNENSGINV